MIRNGLILRMFLATILIYIGITDSDGEAQQPSLAMLMESTKVVPAEESMKVWGIASRFFEQSGTVKVIKVDPNNIFWPTIPAATVFSRNMNADYMLYITLWKQGRAFSYSAKLIRASDGFAIATYKDAWSDSAASTEKAMFKLVSSSVYNSSGKITVNLTIISKPQYADVYRDKDRLGDTGENGFRKTYWWDKGQYEIKVCRPMFRDHKETLNVEANPTDYQREIKLKRE